MLLLVRTRLLVFRCAAKHETSMAATLKLLDRLMAANAKLAQKPVVFIVDDVQTWSVALHALLPEIQPNLIMPNVFAWFYAVSACCRSRRRTLCRSSPGCWSSR